MTPTGVMSSFSSVRIRQRTGKAYGHVSLYAKHPACNTYRDSHSHTNKQHEDGEFNRHCPRLILELIVQSNRNGTTKSKRYRHTRYTNIERHLPVTQQEAQIHFQPDNEEKQGQTDVCNEVEIGH